MDMADGTNDYSEVVEQHQIYKTDWMKWDSVSSEKFTKWIEDSETSGNSDIEELCDSFTSVFKECIDDCVPKGKVNSDNKTQAHPWYNENAKEKKTKLNRAKKLFKQNNTPRNLQLLKECEEAYEQECEKAKTEWANVRCGKIDTCTDPKEKWLSFRKLTFYRERSNVDAFPLHNEKEEVVFAHGEKRKILQNTFFGGSHIANETFDEDFKKEIEQRLLSIRQEVCSEDGDAFLNRPISWDSVSSEKHIHGIMMKLKPQFRDCKKTKLPDQTIYSQICYLNLMKR